MSSIHSFLMQTMIHSHLGKISKLLNGSQTPSNPTIEDFEGNKLHPNFLRPIYKPQDQLMPDEVYQ